MGTGFDALASAGVQAGLDQSRRKQALTDEEHEQQLAEHNNTIKTIQANMGESLGRGLGPGTPEYSALQNKLETAVANRTSLYHPDRPGGLHRLGQLVYNHFHPPQPDAARVTQTNHTAATPATLSATLPPMPGAQTGITTPALPAQPSTATPNLAPSTSKFGRQVAGETAELEAGIPATPQNIRQQLKTLLPNLSDEELDHAVAIKEGVEAKPVAAKTEVWKKNGAPFKDENGDWQQPELNAAGEPRNVPLPGYEQAVKASQSADAVNAREYAKARYGDETHPLTYEDNLNRIKLNKQAATGVTSGSHIAFVPQPDGSIKAIQVSTSSSRNFGGQPVTPAATPANETPAAEKTPRALKSKAAAVAPKGSNGVPKPGDTVGGRMTPAQTKAKEVYDAAKGLSKVADNAAKAQDSTHDKQLALAIIKGSAGRVNMQEYNILVHGLGLANSLEQYASSASTGKFTTELRNQLVNVAKSLESGAKEQYDSSRSVRMVAPNGDEMDVMPDDVKHYESLGAKKQ